MNKYLIKINKYGAVSFFDVYRRSVYTGEMVRKFFNMYSVKNVYEFTVKYNLYFEKNEHCRYILFEINNLGKVTQVFN